MSECLIRFVCRNLMANMTVLRSRLGWSHSAVVKCCVEETESNVAALGLSPGGGNIYAGHMCALSLDRMQNWRKKVRGMPRDTSGVLSLPPFPLLPPYTDIPASIIKERGKEVGPLPRR